MGKVNINEIEHYQEKMQGGFFALKNDKDVARVRFLYETMEDIPVYAVHEIELDGRRKYVNCLRSYDEPLEKCPLCLAKYKLLVKFFLQLYDEDEQIVKVWDRGVTIKGMLEGLTKRCNPLVGTAVEIERSGKPGDTRTTYTPYPLTADGATLEDFPEKTELIGTLILDKTRQELEYFLNHGEFPESTQRTEPATRQPATSRTTRTTSERQTERVSTLPQRRVPRKGNDKF